MPKIPTDTENRISPKFQKRIKELIGDEECSKNEFAERINVSLSVINRAVFYGIIPSLKVLIKIADHFNVSLPYLLGVTDNEAFYKSAQPVAFCGRLDELAEEKGVKYSQIAARMPFTRNYFYEWKRANTLPTLNYLIALANYFGVSVDYLLGRTDYRD